MRLYAGSSANFIALNVNNQIADLLKQEFLKQFGFQPSQNEVMSWRNSLFRLSDIMERANLTDQGIMVEYKLPLSGKRIDVVICGKDGYFADSNSFITGQNGRINDCRGLPKNGVGQVTI